MDGVWRNPRLRRVAIASLAGTTIEWYDFFLYGTAATLVFGRLFFPDYSETAGTLASFATFAAGFAARPLGGVLFGHFGDRLGRKASLVASMMLMGLSTFCIGLLPSFASIGLWAPALLVLLRLLQGIGVGGEWGGAALVAMENAPKGKRGLFSCFPQLGSPIGTIASTGIFAIVSTLPDDQFYAWGWRIPFLLSILLIIVGYIVRSKLDETPEFKAARSERKVVRLPVVELFRTQGKEVLLAAGMRFFDNAAYYLATVFAIDYATKHLDMHRESLLNAILVASLFAIVAIFATGVYSERIGYMRTFLGYAVAGVVFAFPFFGMLDTRDLIVAGAGITIMILISDGLYTVQPVLFTRLFSPEVRYSGVSLGFHLSSTVAGGLSPFIATALYAWADSWWPVALYMVAMGSVSFTCGRIAAHRVRNEEPVPAAAPKFGTTTREA